MISRAAALALLGPLLGLGAVAISTPVRAQARVVSRPAIPQRSLPDTERLFSAGSQDSVPQAVLVELRIRGLASATVQAYRVRTEALLPLAQLLSLAQVRYHLSPDGVLEASVPPGPSRLLVAAGNDTMTFGDHRVRLEPEFRLFKDGELYVGAERLGNLLGSAIVVDWAGLTVTLMDAGMLPIGQRARRDAARAALARRREAAPADVQLGLERQRWDGLVLDYSLFAPAGRPVGAGSYAFDLGGDAFGGSLAIGAHSVGPADAGVARGDVSWTGVWEESAWLKQIRLGDGFSTGPRLRELRGVALTNAPFLRPALLGTSRYLGRLEPGWSVEAYQNGQLLAVDTTDVAGEYGFALPVRYGENPVDFVAYGPLGEIREFDRTYRVLGELLPSRRFEYGLSGGACRDPRCRASGNLDLRYGLTPRVTLQGGADRFWRNGFADLWHPYARVTANPTNDWALELSGVGNALVRGAVLYEPSIDLRVSAAAAAFDTRPEAPIVTVAGQHSAWSVSALVRPLPRYGLFYFEGNLDQVRAQSVTTTRARLGASVQAGATRLMPYVRIERQALDGAGRSTEPFVGVSAFVLPQPQWGPVLGPAFFRGALESRAWGGGSAPRITTASLFASRPLWGGVSLETGLVWQRGSRGPLIQVTLNTYLSAMRSYTTMSAAAGSPGTVSQLVQGSVLWDRAGGRLATAPGPSIERAGVAGRVFLDQNQNGRHDPNEPAVAGVRVVVGSRLAVSDSQGGFRVWDLMPFEPVDVLVDSLSIDSPLLVPAFARATLVPNPNRFRTLDVPIVAAGVIEGHVWREIGGTREPLGGVGLVLTDRRAGTSRRFASFSDGSFYLMGVKAGDYELAVDGTAAGMAESGLSATALRFTIEPEAAASGHSGLDLVLHPAR
ncbi:MAG TPA: hypothetical protein VKP10_00025 [Gemmatimonadales bacterium]|nr:hypothetical protein [Gemmatimonadales bacterium]